MNRLNSKIKNIIFDMNGTMIFDGKYHEIAWKDYAEKLAGRQMSTEEFQHHVLGHTNKDILEYLMGKGTLTEERILELTEGLVKQSGQASFALCQNVYCTADVRHQGLSVALALSQSILQGSEGAWRMQGGGFAGTIQAYVPGQLLERYHTAIEQVFGQGSCYVLRLREQGAVRVI